MESDSVRTSGDSTLVDMWLDGKLRSISISREAIADFLGLPPGEAAALSEDERREFVRTHLTLVATAAAKRLNNMNPGAEVVTIDAGEVHAAGGDRTGDRRGRDRRKGDRRKSERGPPPTGERRRG